LFPLLHLLLELGPVLLVLIVVKWSLQDIASLEVVVAFLVQDDIAVSLEVLVPEVLRHASSLLAVD
jgi:hypothetical protein